MVASAGPPPAPQDLSNKRPIYNRNFYNNQLSPKLIEESDRIVFEDAQYTANSSQVVSYGGISFTAIQRASHAVIWQGTYGNVVDYFFAIGKIVLLRYESTFTNVFSVYVDSVSTQTGLVTRGTLAIESGIKAKFLTAMSLVALRDSGFVAVNAPFKYYIVSLTTLANVTTYVPTYGTNQVQRVATGAGDFVLLYLEDNTVPGDRRFNFEFITQYAGRSNWEIQLALDSPKFTDLSIYCDTVNSLIITGGITSTNGIFSYKIITYAFADGAITENTIFNPDQNRRTTMAYYNNKVWVYCAGMSKICVCDISSIGITSNVRTGATFGSPELYNMFVTNNLIHGVSHDSTVPAQFDNSGAFIYAFIDNGTTVGVSQFGQIPTSLPTNGVPFTEMSVIPTGIGSLLVHEKTASPYISETSTLITYPSVSVKLRETLYGFSD